MLSWTFTAAALIVVLVPQWLPARMRPLVIAVTSLLAVVVVWHVPVLPLLLVTIAVHALGGVLPRLGERGRRRVLALGIVAIVGALAICKTGPGPRTTLAPTTSLVGLSYLSLKLVQHLVDAAAGRLGGIGLPAFVGTIFFLPTYAAGPIERTGTLAAQLAGPPPTWSERVGGVERILFGVGRKLLLADPLLALAEPALGDPAGTPRLWLLAAVYALALGLFLDFAAYSDVAIGLARCAGVRVRENFDRPYLRRNLGVLWQHWHMSLTGWLRDFVFIPVSRRLLRVTGRPLASQVVGQTATMMACGLWHGLTWNFAAWGAYHAVGLGVLASWRAWRGPAPARAPLRDALATVATFHVFALGLLLFACDVPRAALFLGRLLALR
jgi:alginate O-acetyltransferase complex protein AlgI